MKLNKIKKIICFLVLVVMFVSGVLPTGTKIVYGDELDFAIQSDSLFEEIKSTISSTYIAEDGFGYAVIQIKDGAGNLKYPAIRNVEVLFEKNQINISSADGVYRNYSIDVIIKHSNDEYETDVISAKYDKEVGTLTISFCTGEAVEFEEEANAESSGELESVIRTRRRRSYGFP